MVQAALEEDDVPETNDGTPPVVVATPSDESKALLADMAEALANYGNPDPPKGHSSEAQASPTAVAEAAPEAASETPAAADTPPPEPALDFSVYPDNIRPTFEKLHRGELLTREERLSLLKENGKGYLRQSDYTKKRMADAAKQATWEEQKAKEAEYLAWGKSVFEKPHLHAALMKARSEE